MFHTYPESAAGFSLELVPGRRTWDWFELGCNVPMYLVHIEVAKEELTRQFIFSKLWQLLESLKGSQVTEEGGRLSALYLIAPHYISGTGQPTFVELAEVWAKPDHYNDLLYIARDGRRLRFALLAEPSPESELECILKIGA